MFPPNTTTTAAALVQLLHHLTCTRQRLPNSRLDTTENQQHACSVRQHQHSSTFWNGNLSVQQQQYPCDIQAILSSQRQPSLLAAVLPSYHCRQQLLWPSQCRAVCTSAAVAAGGSSGSNSSGSSRDRSATWPAAVPPLHQPQKHVTGTNPLKARTAAVVDEPQASAATRHKPGVGSQHATPAAPAAAPSVFVRHRTSIIMVVLFFTTGAALLLILQEIILGSAPVSLRSNDAAVQKIVLQQLERVLRLRQALGEGLVVELVRRGIIAELVGLIKPGTDALVLIQTCDMLKGLLDSPLAVSAMHQAGLRTAVSSALQEGWVPTGAVTAVSTLNRAMGRS